MAKSRRKFGPSTHIPSNTFPEGEAGVPMRTFPPLYEKCPACNIPGNLAGIRPGADDDDEIFYCENCEGRGDVATEFGEAVLYFLEEFLRDPPALQYAQKVAEQRKKEVEVDALNKFGYA